MERYFNYYYTIIPFFHGSVKKKILFEMHRLILYGGFESKTEECSATHSHYLRNKEILAEGAVFNLMGFYPAEKAKLSIVPSSVLSHSDTNDWRAFSKTLCIGRHFEMCSYH